MTTHHIPAIASELALNPGAVQAVADLLAEGAPMAGFTWLGMENRLNSAVMP